MTETRQRLVDLFYRGHDPFAGGAEGERQTDFQGWSSSNPLLARGVNEIKPHVVVEVGVWKGGSTMTMAEEMKKLSIDGCVIAVDTWVGSWEHWFIDEHFEDLKVENGYPSIFKTFVANVCARGLQDYVVPLPLDSLNAGSLLKRHDIQPDIIHLDGGHDYEVVIADIRFWWPLLKVGGAFIGDDYFLDGQTWAGVKQAFDEFFYAPNIEVVESKCWIKKLA